MSNEIQLEKNEPVYLKMEDGTTLIIVLEDNGTIKVMANKFGFAVFPLATNHIKLIKANKLVKKENKELSIEVD